PNLPVVAVVKLLTQAGKVPSASTGTRGTRRARLPRTRARRAAYPPASRGTTDPVLRPVARMRAAGVGLQGWPFSFAWVRWTGVRGHGRGMGLTWRARNRGLLPAQSRARWRYPRWATGSSGAPGLNSLKRGGALLAEPRARVILVTPSLSRPSGFDFPLEYKHVVVSLGQPVGPEQV